MNDICFEMNNLYFAWRACAEAQSTVRESIFGFDDAVRKLENELSLFNNDVKTAVSDIQNHISAVKNMIEKTEQKLAAANGKKRQEIKPPERPSVPQNAPAALKNAIICDYQKRAEHTYEQNANIREQNRVLDEYISKCNGAKKELEAVIGEFYRLEAMIKSEAAAANSAVGDFLGRARDISGRGTKINAAMGEFYRVFDRVYLAAQKIYMMEPSDVKRFLYIDKQFAIKNTHSHISQGGKAHYSGDGARSASGAEAENTAPYTEETLVKERDAQAFLELAQNALRIKMPSANLHKLGGKAFIAKMNESGFSIAMQADGTAIDSNGMIHWEKNDGNDLY